MKTSPHYHPSLCAYCHQGGMSPPGLRRCSSCKCFYYCSKECQREAWKKGGHKELCARIVNSSQGRSHFFSGHTGKTVEQWTEACRQNEIRFSDSGWLRMFSSPPVCIKPGCYSPVGVGYGGALLPCEGCLSVFYCSDQHRRDRADHHGKFCSELKLTRLADSAELTGRIVHYHADLDMKYHGTAENLKAFLIERNFYDHKDALSSINTDTRDERNSVFISRNLLTDDISGPMTILDIGHKFIPDFGKKKSLEIHVVGASGYEMRRCDLKWEYLAHRLPALRSLVFKFVGPHCQSPSMRNNIVERRPTCGPCSSLGRDIYHGYYPLTYQQFRQRDNSVPDLVLAQNCGFHVTADLVTGELMWKDGANAFRSLLHNSRVPLAFTSFTEEEGMLDLVIFAKFCGSEIEMLVTCEENPMRSLRPRREELKHEGVPLYNNYFITVVRPSK